MTIEANRGVFSPEKSGEKTIVTTVNKLLPGINTKEEFSSLYISAARQDQNYTLRFNKIFDNEEIRLLLLNLSDRAVSITPGTTNYKTTGRDGDLPAEIQKLVIASSGNILEDAADNFRTFEQAEHLFVHNPRIGREYTRVHRAKNPDQDVSKFIGQIADLIKKNPQFWRSKKNFSRVSDETAFSRFAQLGSVRIQELFTLFESAYGFEEKQSEIENYMKIFQGSKALKQGEKIAGFIKTPNSVSQGEGFWTINKPGNLIRILKVGSGIEITCQNPNVLIGEISWNNVGNRRAYDTTDEDESTIVTKKSNKNDQLTLVYNLKAENISSLLGVMILDHIANIRGRYTGRDLPTSSIPEDSYSRRSILLNSELIRNTEVALAA